ncbi:MAG: hypothetical protein ACOX8U_02840 [Bradymonadia bacterium]|jgi:hypothetical protein
MYKKNSVIETLFLLSLFSLLVFTSSCHGDAELAEYTGEVCPPANASEVAKMLNLLNYKESIKRCKDGYKCSKFEVNDNEYFCAEDCPNMQKLCPNDQGVGVCINNLIDNQNCGDCGNKCNTGELCHRGTCVYCAEGNIICETKCIDPKTNKMHCGAKGECTDAAYESINYVGMACADNLICKDSECVCEGIICDNKCIDPSTNVKHCGAKGACNVKDVNDNDYIGEQCDESRMCKDGSCQCKHGFVECDGNCIDPANDMNYCGAQAPCSITKGNICNPENQHCVEGKCLNFKCANPNEILCPNEVNLASYKCVNITARNPEHCGACNWKCADKPLDDKISNTCIDGKCVYACADGYKDCKKSSDPHPVCIKIEELQKNALHCGDCNIQCRDDAPVCESGSCQNNSCENLNACAVQACRFLAQYCGKHCIDCNKNFHAAKGECLATGQCSIKECIRGFHLSADEQTQKLAEPIRACVENTNSQCAPVDSYEHKDCNGDALPENAVSGICSPEGNCIALKCADSENPDNPFVLRDGACVLCCDDISNSHCMNNRCFAN